MDRRRCPRGLLLRGKELSFIHREWCDDITPNLLIQGYRNGVFYGFYSANISNIEFLKYSILT